MARTFTPPPATISEALSLLPGDVLRPMMGLLPLARPLPTRKADMVAAIERHLSGTSLQKLWDKLDETQRLAVSEALDTPHAVFDQHQFQAKYGKLPFGFDSTPSPTKASPLRFFLYATHRYEPPTIVAPDLAQHLRAFVPPPPVAEVAAADELPDTVQQPRSRYVRRGKKREFDPVDLTRRDMEQAGQHDLAAVLRLIELRRFDRSTRSQRCRACGATVAAIVITATPAMPGLSGAMRTVWLTS